MILNHLEPDLEWKSNAKVLPWLVSNHARPHCGLDDAKNIARLVAELLRQGWGSAGWLNPGRSSRYGCLQFFGCLVIVCGYVFCYIKNFFWYTLVGFFAKTYKLCMACQCMACDSYIMFAIWWICSKGESDESNQKGSFVKQEIRRWADAKQRSLWLLRVFLEY